MIFCQNSRDFAPFSIFRKMEQRVPKNVAQNQQNFQKRATCLFLLIDSPAFFLYNTKLWVGVCPLMVCYTVGGPSVDEFLQ